MNYLAEILAFSEWKEVNPLPASAIVLWHELMAVCNKAGWLQEFTVANGLLQARCGLSRKEFDHARSLLINFGLIKYKKSERVNQAGKYMLVSFVQKRQREGQQEGQREEHGRDNTGGNVGDTLYKRKPKQKDIDKTKSVCDSLTKILNRPIGSRDWSLIRGWLDDGIEELVVLEAVKLSSHADSPIPYADKIIIDWDKKGIKTIAQVLENLQRKNDKLIPFKREKEEDRILTFPG